MIFIILQLLGISLIGAIIAAVVGTFWYSNATPMGKIHMKYLGFDNLTDEEKKQKMIEAKPMMWKMYTGQIVLSLLTAFSVTFITILSIRNGLSLGAGLGFVAFNWLCFMVPIIGSGILWSNCDRSIAWKKFFSDIASNLVIVVLISLMASLFA
jgi:hypothetical protein